MPRPVNSTVRKGRLRIGDQWNAINIIAHSQTHPLKAICELVENAIDAKASRIVVSRRRKAGKIHLEIADDGTGVVLDDGGEPNFVHIATHICDSMKRCLDDREQQHIHGEFGIGLLSFWSLGDQLRMISAANNGRLLEMVMERGKPSYFVRPVRGQIATGGTRVIVGPLLDSTRSVITGEKLRRYLAAELRDRIRATGVQITILDRVARKNLLVKPREFEGELIIEAKDIVTPHGRLVVELYLRPASATEDVSVAACKDGTRVIPDITQLPHFQRPPWTDHRLEGVLDFPALQLAPGTRSGIVPDERFEVFVSAVNALEPILDAAIERWDEAESSRASDQIMRRVQRAFQQALRELPQNEYVYFDVPEPGIGRSAETSTQAADGFPVKSPPSSTAVETEESPSLIGGLPTLPFEVGPLAGVAISPRHARRAPGQACKLTARAVDENGLPIESGVEMLWRMVDGAGKTFDASATSCHVTADEPTVCTVGVTARQGTIEVSDSVQVRFVELSPDVASDNGKGLPSYRLQSEPMKTWRSMYEANKNEIVINSAHRDFLFSKNSGPKHRRYVGKLYAKEVVLLNFPHESASQVMERLIQILLRTEESL